MAVVGTCDKTCDKSYFLSSKECKSCLGPNRPIFGRSQQGYKNCGVHLKSTAFICCIKLINSQRQQNKHVYTCIKMYFQ